ncbi:MAG: hypothetical protein J0H63_04530 [Rhizobiales bacterium]|nr:hypothetical protein [Hyphomicrobiales bacterium]
MGSVLQIASTRRPRRRTGRAATECQIVIFPGVRIERHADEELLDLGHRLLDPVTNGDFGGFDDFGGSGRRRPRRTS